MKHIRLFVLSVMALFALGAVASASASAAACEEEDNAKDVYTVCVGGKDFTGKLTNVNHAVSSVLTGKVLGVETELTGTTAVAELTAEKDGASKGKITFTGITVVKPKHCTVVEPIVAEFTDQLSKPPAAPIDIFTGSKPGEVFTEIAFEGAECTLAGQVVQVKGKQEAEFDAGIATAAKDHEVIAKATGSKLKLGESEAHFSGIFTQVETAGGENWSILES